MASQPLATQIAELLEDENPGNITLQPCDVGGNNRVFVVIMGGRRLVAKWYFSHPSDTRNRLRAEFAFLNYARRLGLSCVPEPVACDPARNLAIYEFIEGTKLSPQDITREHIDQALRFFLAINRQEHRPFAETLPLASEACFAIAEHLDLMEGRIERLSRIPPQTDIDREAIRFTSELREGWRNLKFLICQEAKRQNQDPLAPLPDRDRCVSPSDFGFHNALFAKQGELCFIDFEYSGWDDPAKMTADFFCQPAVPVDRTYFDYFLETAMSCFAERRQVLVNRARLLFPLFQMKWCCIILNDFLPESLRRRKFANPELDETQRKRIQLSKARAIFRASQQ